MWLHRTVRLEAADLAGAAVKDVPGGTRTYSPEDLSDVTFHEEGHELIADGFVPEVAVACCESARRWVESDCVTAVEFV